MNRRLFLRLLAAWGLLPFVLSAQPVITKDVNSCLYGLKDASGKWIIEPHYTRIQPFRRSVAIVMLNNQYGLISTTGEEIVPCVYSEVREPCFAFVEHYPSENGGTTSSIRFYDGKDLPQRFIVKKGMDYGMLDSAGNFLLPVEFASIGCIYNRVMQVESNKGRMGFADIDHGMRGWLPENVADHSDGPEPIGKNLFYVTGFREEMYKGKSRKMYGHGVCNDSGRVIIPFLYDSINTQWNGSGLIEVYKSKKTGYYDSTGKMIFDAVYVVPGARQRMQPQINFSNDELAKKDGKWGAIERSGQVTLPFEYDSLVPCWSDYTTRHAHYWKIRKDGKWGLLDREKNVVEETKYDRLEELGAGYYYDTSPRVFAAKADGKWWAIDQQENKIVDEGFDTAFAAQNLFWSPEDAIQVYAAMRFGTVGLYDFNPEAENVRWEYGDSFVGAYWTLPDSTVREVVQSNRMDWYYGEYEEKKEKFPPYYYSMMLNSASVIIVEHVKFYPSADARLLLPDTATQRWKQESFFGNGQLFAIYRDGKSGRNSLCTFLPMTSENDTAVRFFTIGSGLIDCKGKIILVPDEVREFYPMKESSTPDKTYFLVVANSGHYGVVDENGKLVIDTTYQQIREGKRDTAWVKMKRKDSKLSCSPDGWNLCVLHSGKMLLGEEQLVKDPFTFSATTQVAETGTGQGLIDTRTLKFILPPIYQALLPLDPYSMDYAVNTMSGHVGIVTAEGKWVTDTIWNKIVRTTASTFQLSDDKTKSMILPPRFVLEADGKYAVYDVKGFRLVGTSDRRRLEQDAIDRQNRQGRAWNYGDSYCGNCPGLSNTFTLKDWQDTILFNALFGPGKAIDFRSTFCQEARYDYGYLGCEGAKIRPWSTYYNYVKQEVLSQGDSCMSVMVMTEMPGFSAPYVYTEYTHYNYVEEKNGPHAVTLDSLFAVSGWENVIINAVVNYVNEHPGTDMPCTNLAGLPKLLNERFSFSPQGLVLYPDWHFKTNGEKLDAVSLLIPWKELRPYMSARMRSKLGVD